MDVLALCVTMPHLIMYIRNRIIVESVWATIPSWPAITRKVKTMKYLKIRKAIRRALHEIEESGLCKAELRLETALAVDDYMRKGGIIHIVPAEKHSTRRHGYNAGGR